MQDLTSNILFGRLGGSDARVSCNGKCVKMYHKNVMHYISDVPRVLLVTDTALIVVTKYVQTFTKKHRVEFIPTL